MNAQDALDRLELHPPFHKATRASSIWQRRINTIRRALGQRDELLAMCKKLSNLVRDEVIARDYEPYYESELAEADALVARAEGREV